MAEIEKETGRHGSCIAAQLDVSDPSSVKAFVSEVASAYDQQIYALINNAAVFPHGWTSDAFDTATATNFTSPLDLALGLAPHIVPGTFTYTMLKPCSRDQHGSDHAQHISFAGGRIVHVTSGLGQLTNLSPGYRAKVMEADSIDSLRSIAFDPSDSNGASSPTYNLTKAMLNRLSQLSVGHPAFKHLAVNSADPGWVRTRMGGPNASRSIDQGSESIYSVLDLPADSTGGFWFDSKPKGF